MVLISVTLSMISKDWNNYAEMMMLILLGGDLGPTQLRPKRSEHNSPLKRGALAVTTAATAPFIV